MTDDITHDDPAIEDVDDDKVTDEDEAPSPKSEPVPDDDTEDGS